MAGGIEVVFDVSEVVDLSRALQRLGDADLAPLMRDAAAAGASATQARIDAGGPAPDGTQWPARDSRDPGTHPLLSRTGSLAESLETESDADTAAWGSNLVYARIHQLGGVVEPVERETLRYQLGAAPYFARSVEIPARPYLGIGDAEERLLRDVVEDWVEQYLEVARP